MREPASAERLAAARAGLRSAIQLVAQLSVLATIFILLARTWWFFELFSHFRIQLLIFQLLLLIVLLIQRQTLWVVLIGIASAVNGIAVRDYLFVGEDFASQDATTAAVRVLSANVLANNPDPAKLVDLLQTARPDVFAVIEFTDPFATALRAIEADYPHRVLVPESGAFGIAVYSRWPIRTRRLLDLNGFTAIDAEIESDFGVWHFIAAHPVPPVGSEMASIRNRQLNDLAQYVADLTAPHVVAGDFNLTPFSPHFTDFIAHTGLKNSLRGPTYTWPASFPLLGIPIDHVLISAEFFVIDHIRANDIGSDHFPVIVDMISDSTGPD